MGARLGVPLMDGGVETALAFMATATAAWTAIQEWRHRRDKARREAAERDRKAREAADRAAFEKNLARLQRVNDILRARFDDLVNRAPTPPPSPPPIVQRR